MKFLDPRNDIAFKKIFGNENKKEILISFLNAVLDFKGEKTIIDVQLGNPYQLPDIGELKETILDIKATNQHGDHFIVEMQKKHSTDFHKRSVYYTAKTYVNQLEIGADYNRLKKVYYIALVDFNIFDNTHYISRHLIINLETQTQDLQDIEFSFIELRKFKKSLKACKNIIDKWIYFINNASSLDMIPDEFERIEEIKQAFTIANEMSWNKEEMEVYRYVNMEEAYDLSALKTAEKKGIKQGIEQGFEKGIEQGTVNVAISLFDVLDDETIAEKTGLSLARIRELRKSTELRNSVET